MHGVCVCECVCSLPFYLARQNLFMHLCRKYNNKTALFIVEQLQKLHFMDAHATPLGVLAIFDSIKRHQVVCGTFV